MSAQTTATSTPTTTTTKAAPAGTTAISALDSDHGRTSIADTVVGKIAGIAAREVSGVYAIGGGAARALGAVRDVIPGARRSVSQGVTVEVGEREAAVDVDIVAEYGVSIADLASGIRENVIRAVEGMTGLQVTEVNISVYDIHLPEADDAADAEPVPSRVR